MLMKTLISLVFILLAGCSSKEKAVNSSPIPAYVPVMMSQSATNATDAISQASSSAIEGKLLLQQEIPTPLVHVQMGLYKKQMGIWTEVAKLSTEQGGAFRFTQKLTNGIYELRVLSSKYQGNLTVTLDGNPARDLIVYAEMH